MFLNSLDKKPLLKKKDGKIIRDLSKSIFDWSADNNVTYSAYKVPAEYVMRPDLISQAMYNNTIYTEFILKYNGISNPLSINVDDVILIPGLDSAKKNIKKQGERSEDDIANEIRKTYKYIDPSKKPKITKETKDFNNRDLDPDLIETELEPLNLGTGTIGTKIDTSELMDGALPANISQKGVSQITYRNGRVYFGEGIGQSACLKSGMSSSEFLTKIIQSHQIL